MEKPGGEGVDAVARHRADRRGGTGVPEAMAISSTTLSSAPLACGRPCRGRPARRRACAPRPRRRAASGDDLVERADDHDRPGRRRPRRPGVGRVPPGERRRGLDRLALGVRRQDGRNSDDDHGVDRQDDQGDGQDEVDDQRPTSAVGPVPGARRSPSYRSGERDLGRFAFGGSR